VLPWYQPQPLSPLPPVSLAGKIILIDPGHGNAASGAIGAGGAKEKDINLAVARYLKTLLVNQGASVYMTREADTSTLWPMNLSSREDLHKRCLYRDSLVPDLFVSIHHNGSEDGLLDVNSAKTFYAMGDAGASLDAARFINMEFTEVLGLGQSELLCGNYFVLRNSKVPTLLGEPSYLSNPVMERILCDSSAQKLEATAYFRGIVKWFSLGVLKITGFSIDSVRGSVTATIWSEATLDPLLTGIFLDQTRLNGRISKNGYTAAIPLPLKNGIHTFKCSAGNVSGNLATSATFSYTVDRPAETLIAAVENESVSFLAPLRGVATLG
jgi:N-acetylmuramoyl-L-alanine amidase